PLQPASRVRTRVPLPATRYRYYSTQGSTVRSCGHARGFAPCCANTENDRSQEPTMEFPMTDAEQAHMERDVMEYDVVTVGAGPAGLSFAIRLKQLNPELTVCVIEKSSTIGAHILSGAVIEPGPLDALLP